MNTVDEIQITMFSIHRNPTTTCYFTKEIHFQFSHFMLPCRRDLIDYVCNMLYAISEYTQTVKFLNLVILNSYCTYNRLDTLTVSKPFQVGFSSKK